MKNLHFAIICSYNCVKYLNELEELTEEQRDLLFEFECNAWSQVTEDDMQEFFFNGEYAPLYQAIKKEVLEVLQNNHSYDYLQKSVYYFAVLPTLLF